MDSTATVKLNEKLAAASLLKARRLDAMKLDETAKNTARLVYLLLTLSPYVAVRPKSFSLALGLTQDQAKKILISLVDARVLKFSESWGFASQINAWIFGPLFLPSAEDIQELASGPREALDKEFTALMGHLPYPFLAVDLYKRTRQRSEVISHQGFISGQIDGLIFRVQDWAKANSKKLAKKAE